MASDTDAKPIPF